LTVLKEFQAAFIEFAIENEVLQFGEFELKSGRVSPYFFNAGKFDHGSMLSRLGRFYADALIDAGLPFDLLFGPAYKGIPLVSATAIALADNYRRDTPYAFNRKEAKDHGEGGVIVGAPLEGRVVIVDDVITAGTAIREVFDVFSGYPGVQPSGALVAIDRQEKGASELSAIQEIELQYGVSVVSVVKLTDIVNYIEGRPAFARELDRIKEYRELYGVAA
jgi:orotate phosphoribosyltransferase